MSSLIKYVADEKFWSLSRASVSLSGHMHRGSAYETDDGCGNCDGARCDTCEPITTAAHYECSIGVDLLEEMLIKEGMSEEDASNMAYSDYCGPTLPTEGELRAQYPDVWKALHTEDPEVHAHIQAEQGKHQCWADLARTVEASMGLPKYTYSGHVVNQLEAYWAKCGYDHNKACGIVPLVDQLPDLK